MLIVLKDYLRAKYCFEQYEHRSSSAIHPLGKRPPKPARHFADKPRNLDFNIIEPSNPDYGWFKTGATPEEYDFGIEECIKTETSNCKYIRSIVPQPQGSAATGQAFSAVQYREQLLCLSTEMRTEEVKGSAMLWLRADGEEDNMVSFDNTRYRPVQGTADWTHRDIIIYVPKTSVALVFGATLAGVGCAWFRNMRLDVVET
jgi:hypothetical protein